MQTAPIEVELEDVMGSDLRVANVARVSFKKRHTQLEERDIRLLGYLSSHNHWTPFAHVFASFRIRCCIAVARQLAKSQVGLVWNEESRRYISEDPLFFIPSIFRQSVKDKKQGSGFDCDPAVQEWAAYRLHWHYDKCLKEYVAFLEAGVCEEQSRLVLPVGAHTEFIWSGSLAAFARVINLRCDPHAQEETRSVAYAMYNQLLPHFPNALAELCPNVLPG